MEEHIQRFIDSDLLITFLIDEEVDKDLVVRKDVERYIDDPLYRGTYLFNTSPELSKQYKRDHDVAVIDRHFTNFKEDGVSLHSQKKDITWPSGAKLRLDYVNLDRHADYNHGGMAYSALFWNELTEQSSYQFEYLLTRMRSAAKCDSYTKVFTKTDKDHFSYDFLKPFLEGTKESGETRYFYYKGGSIEFVEDSDELEFNYKWANGENHKCKVFPRPYTVYFKK